MKLYLDNCGLQRPLDTKTQIRVSLEAEAVLGILTYIEDGRLELISSEVLVYEIGRNLQPTRQEYALEVLAKAQTFIAVTEVIEKRSREFLVLGIKPLDALHLASAEVAEADYFCTCDDGLLTKSKNLSNYRVKVVSPLVLIEELEP